MPAPCNAKPISLGSTPWNEILPIELLSLGILATRSEQNLYRPSDPIPPGFTPWNQNPYLKHPTFECQFTQSRHNLCDRLNSIPLGTGKQIKKLKKKLRPLAELTELFCFNSLTVFDKMM